MIVGFLLASLFVIFLTYINIYENTTSDLQRQVLKAKAVGVLLVLFVGSMIGAYVVSRRPVQQEILTTDEIYAIKDSTGLSGDFFLGSGSMDNGIYYTVLMKNEKGQYYQKMIELDRNKVFIVEDDNEIPRIEFIKEYRAESFGKIFDFHGDAYYYIVYIPEGSIVKNYEIG